MQLKSSLAQHSLGGQKKKKRKFGGFALLKEGRWLLAEIEGRETRLQCSYVKIILFF
jgi:hypothetical protein